MQYRTVSAEERLELMELQAQAFFFTYDRKKYAEQMADGDTKQSGRGLFDDRGRLAAGLELIPLDCWFDGNTAGMGGIGGVACWPERRNEGCTAELLRQTLREMLERGDVFSFLYPFSYRYYRKFGYEACMKANRVTGPLEPLRALRRPGSPERFVPGKEGTDPTPVVEVYNDFAKRYNLAADREGWRWHELLEQDPMRTRRQVFVWRTPDGLPGAYAIFRAEPENEPNVLRVLEAAWRSPEALLGLMGFLSGFSSNLKQIVWEVPPDVDPSLLWQECEQAKGETTAGGMCRVVNVPKALRLMAAPEGMGSVRISVQDETLPENTGVYKVDWEGGACRARRVKGPYDMACPVTALVQLVTGYLPFAELRLRGDVEVSAKDEELEKLFVKKDVHLIDKF